jgi:hypothetical protein
MEDNEMGRKPRVQVDAESDRREQEINARVDERVNALFAELKAQLEPGAISAPAQAVASSNDGMGNLLSELVMNMKKMMDPQSQKRVFSPEEMRQMESARENMIRLIVEAHERREAGDANAMPVYALKAKVYLAERKIEPQYFDKRTERMMPQEINWPGIPSEAMHPINDVAKKIHAAFMGSLLGINMNKNTAPSFVLDGSKVLRMAPVEFEQVGNSGTADPRKMIPGVEPIDYSKPINVLGTVAAPMAPTFGSRFDVHEPIVRNG